MSSSSNSNKTSSEETTKTVDDGSPSYGSNGRKLTPLPITTPNAKPGQNQVIICNYEFISYENKIIIYLINVIVHVYSHFNHLLYTGCCS